MNNQKSIAGALALMLSFSPTLAATSVAQLDHIQGKVLVNQGNGYTPAGQSAALKPGDKIFVGKAGGAVLTYSSGCSVSVASASVVTVQDRAPCAEGDTVAAFDSVMVSPARGARAPAYGGGAVYVPIVVSVSVLVTVLVSVWINGHNGGGTPVSAP
jgi:hypothetical protein